MAWWDRLLGRKDNPVGAANVSIVSPGQPVWTAHNYAAIAREGYQRNPVVFAAVNQIAASAAGIRLRAYRDDKPVDDHPLGALFDRPNARSGRAKFMRAVVAQLYIAGNAYVQAVSVGSPPRPKELWSLRPDRTKVVPGANGEVAAFLYEVGARKDTIPADEVCQLAFFHPTDDWYGLSPLVVASRTIDMQNSGDDWNTALLQNFARPSGALVVEETLAEEQYDRISKLLDRKYSGPRNARRPILLEGGMKWQPMSFSPTDLDWLNGDRAAGLKIAMALGVPPEIIGDSSSRTYSNYKEARQSFYTETVLPLLDLILDDWNAWLAPAYGDEVRLGYDPTSIEALQEDQNDLNDRLRKSVDSGIRTPNEAREKLGLPPHADGDTLRALQPPATPQTTGSRSITILPDGKALLNEGTGD